MGVFLLGPSYVVGETKGISTFARELAQRRGINFTADKVPYPTERYAVGKTLSLLEQGDEVVIDGGRLPSIAEAIQQEPRITEGLRQRLHIYNGPNSVN